MSATVTPRLVEVADAVRRHNGRRSAAAAELGIAPGTVRAMVGRYEFRTGTSIDAPPARGERRGDPNAFAANTARAADRLTSLDIAEGRLWWPRATAEVAWLAEFYGLPFRRVAHAAAALSPGLRWEATLDTLRLLLDARAAGEPSFPRGSGHLTFGYRDRAKAWAILCGEIATCRGPKVEAIAANLLGDLDRVAVDRHVVRAATGRDIRQVSPTNMSRIAGAVRLLATIRGLRPAELQAALWVAGQR